MVINTEQTEIQIDAGTCDESTVTEIYRNLQLLYATHAGEQALDRDFGINMDAADYPQEGAQALLVAEFTRKTTKYEPRARVARVEWAGNGAEGYYTPRVVIELV